VAGGMFFSLYVVRNGGLRVEAENCVLIILM
jgi:hypothetical protein